MSKLDIIVPCFNPSEGWAEELLENFTLFTQKLKGVKVGLILVNDGSTSNFDVNHIQLLKSQVSDFQIIEYDKNQGKGFALREGVKLSLAGTIIFTDIDFPYELDSMVSVYKELQSDFDVVVGSRNDSYYVKTPWFRKVLSKTFRYLLKLMLNLKVSDTQCGLKGFKQKGKEEFLRTTINRFLFDLEFVKRCSKRKDLAIKSTTVTLKENVIFSQMNLKILVTEFLNFLVILIKN